MSVISIQSGKKWRFSYVSNADYFTCFLFLLFYYLDRRQSVACWISIACRCGSNSIWRTTDGLHGPAALRTAGISGVNPQVTLTRFPFIISDYNRLAVLKSLKTMVVTIRHWIMESGRVPRQFHTQNAGFFQLGLGTGFPFYGPLVFIYFLIMILLMNCFTLANFGRERERERKRGKKSWTKKERERERQYGGK